MRIFIAGATGVIGRRAVPRLVGLGHQVTAAGRDPARLASLARAGAAAIPLDLFDRNAVGHAVAGHDVVVNLATHIPSPTWRMLLRGAWRENDRVRREGAAHLAEGARVGGAARFVQESFAPIYEDGGDRWLDETAPVRPSPYNQSVLDAEEAARHFGGDGRAGVVLRFAAFYGPDARHFRDMMQTMRLGVAPLPGRPDAYVSSISHDDAAAAVVRALELPGGVYNVCDDEPLTRRAYVAAAADAFGVPVPRPMPRLLTRLMGAAGELLARSQRMSNGKLRATGWAPRDTSVRVGFPAVARATAAASAASAAGAAAAPADAAPSDSTAR